VWLRRFQDGRKGVSNEGTSGRLTISRNDQNEEKRTQVEGK
jgi:hypothetical protein